MLSEVLDLRLAPLARTVAEDCKHNHYQHGHEDHDDRDLHEEQKKTDEPNQLLEQSNNEQNQGDDGSEATGCFKSAYHKIEPRKKSLT